MANNNRDQHSNVISTTLIEIMECDIFYVISQAPEDCDDLGLETYP